MVEKLVVMAAEHPKATLVTIGALVIVNCGITAATVVKTVQDAQQIEEVNKKLDELIKAINELDDEETDESSEEK